MATAHGSLRVRVNGATRQLQSSAVYFTFASGRFDYDCASCGSTCCKGYGYHLFSPSEVAEQVGMRPSLRFFLQPLPSRPESVVRGVQNCPSGCFFLTPAGLCGIEVERGHGAKPEACRLFPFNYLRRLDGHLIVGMHPTLCPLRVVPAGSMSHASAHATLLREMAVIEDEPVAVESVYLPAEDALLLERRIVDAAEEFLNAESFEAFVSAQLAQTFAALRSDTSAARCDAIVRECAAAMQRLFGDPPTARACADRELIRVMVATTPRLRAQLVFQPAASIRRVPLAIEQVPLALFVLYTLIAYARDAGLPAVTYQTVMKVFEGNKTLIGVIAQALTRVSWRPSAAVPLVSGPMTRAAKRAYFALVKDLLSARGRVLGELLAEHCPRDGYDRVAVLRQVTAVVADYLVADSARPPAASIRHSQALLQRWLVRRMPVEALLALSERRRSTITLGYGSGA